MSRRRYLSTNAGRDKALRDVAVACPDAAIFYLLAIPCAGDDAALPAADPDELRWEVWPARDDLRAEDVERFTAALIEHGLWEQAPDGTVRFPLEPFYRYQTYIRAERRAGVADGAVVRSTTEAAAQNSAKQRTSAQNSASFNPSFRSKLQTPPEGERETAAREAPSPPPEGLKPAREPASRPDRTPTASPAVRVYHQITERMPPAALRSRIDAAVSSDDGGAMAVWRRVIVTWLERGYKRENLAGMLEWFAAGGPPETGPPARAGPNGRANGRGSLAELASAMNPNYYHDLLGDFGGAQPNHLRDAVHQAHPQLPAADDDSG